MKTMDDSWPDGTQNDQEFESPAWHEDLLNEREQRLRVGDETPIDWEAAKQELLDLCLPENKTDL
jgi:hypothetical protein